MESKTVYVKNLPLGGGNPILVQSMCTERLENTSALITEINRLDERGARIVRFAVRNIKEARLIDKVVNKTRAALCADIHFDHRLALEAINRGIHKIRLNPGNIQKKLHVKEVVHTAQAHNVPIRIGVNGGSIDKTKYPGNMAEAMVKSAIDHILILEDLDFTEIVVSLKSSDIKTTIEANRLFSQKHPYPIHLGVTEAGFGTAGIIKSSIALGTLLLDGIGNTIRVSLTGDPKEEIDAAYKILASCDKLEFGINIISCPTCGRTDPTVDLREIAEQVESTLIKKYSSRIKANKQVLQIAVMGCEVNGPGKLRKQTLVSPEPVISFCYSRRVFHSRKSPGKMLPTRYVI
jgi:(E)-4-hydroxy-3-methylbut-2-enyl-diphosphate synthase